MPPFLLCDESRTGAGDAHEFNRRQLHRRMVEDCVSLWECSPATKRSLRVLIVDEDQCGNDALATLVRSWGHEVRSAQSGAGGRSMAAVQQPDIVLMDTSLLNVDAFETARQLRHDRHPSACFIIAVTENANEECRRRCLESGVDLLLIKPVDGFVLQTLLLLEGERLDRSLTTQPAKCIADVPRC
jgi:CheY-like chemotaxis protein